MSKTEAEKLAESLTHFVTFPDQYPVTYKRLGNTDVTIIKAAASILSDAVQRETPRQEPEWEQPELPFDQDNVIKVRFPDIEDKIQAAEEVVSGLLDEEYHEEDIHRGER